MLSLCSFGLVGLLSINSAQAASPELDPSIYSLSQEGPSIPLDSGNKQVIKTLQRKNLPKAKALGSLTSCGIRHQRPISQPLHHRNRNWLQPDRGFCC